MERVKVRGDSREKKASNLTASWSHLKDSHCLSPEHYDLNTMESRVGQQPLFCHLT